MTEVIVNKTINVSAEKAWEKLSSFKGIEEFSPIERSETIGTGAGAKRTCYMPDGAAIHEILELIEEDRMEMQYIITDGPFPVSNYVSSIKVEATRKNSCKITWGCEFDSAPEVKEEMEKLFGGFYVVIIDSLENLIQNQN